MNFDRDKFKALVQYICWRCDDPTKLGSTKLNKVLWRSDMQAYYWFGEPVTGAKYVNRQHGPVPTAILPVLGELSNEGVLAIREVDHYGLPKREFFALKQPALTRFSPDEISLIDQSIDYVCHKHTARSISEETHDDIWKLAEIGEEIPYATVFAAQLGEITEDDIAWAKHELAELTLQ